jgi:phage/plasmid-like protein (TIGR03299 family)
VSHGLEMSAGDGSFVYRAEGGEPWHHLGVSVRGHRDADTMLALAFADYDVALSELFVWDPRTGEPVPVERQYATARVNPHTGVWQPLGVVKGRYTVLQNRTALEYALDVVGASHGEAVLDTVGVLDDGRQFFATIDLGALVLDPVESADEVGRFLVVRTSHDGSTALTFANTNVRAVCRNTVILGEREAVRVFKAKHTPNVEDRMGTAREVLRLSVAWAEEFALLAEELRGISMTASKWDRVVEAVFPTVDVVSARKRKSHGETVELVRAIYAGPRNVGAGGATGWAAYNALVEYFDHWRPGSVQERALTSMDEGSWVSRKKKLAHQVVLSLA